MGQDQNSENVKIIPLGSKRFTKAERIRYIEREITVNQMVEDFLIEELVDSIEAELTLARKSEDAISYIENRYIAYCEDFRCMKYWQRARIKSRFQIAEELAEMWPSRFSERGRSLNPLREEIGFYSKVIAWSEFLNWLQIKIKSYSNYTEKPVKENKIDQEVRAQITQAQLALFYVYLHVTESTSDFGKHPGGKLAAYEEAAAEYGLKAKPFQVAYNRFTSFSERTASNNISNLEFILPMLREYPKAQRKANDELKAAKVNKQNK